MCVDYIVMACAVSIAITTTQFFQVDAWSANTLIKTSRQYATTSSFSSTKPFVVQFASTTTRETTFLYSHDDDGRHENEHEAAQQVKRPTTNGTPSIVLGTIILWSVLSMNIVTHPSPAYGYSSSTGEYISEPVQIAIQAVQNAKTNNELIKAYENIAEIITEGKGIGGNINFQGIQLDRGYVSDEDTSIYNPGLTLLTESEKTQLVNTIVSSKKQQLSNYATEASDTAGATESWNTDLEAGYSFLRERLDPLHMYELQGYLSILPIYGAVMYLVALIIQQVSRDLFPIAYIVCASAVFVPIIALVLLGPQ
jgi:hypothetical protein